MLSHFFFSYNYDPVKDAVFSAISVTIRRSVSHEWARTESRRTQHKAVLEKGQNAAQHSTQKRQQNFRGVSKPRGITEHLFEQKVRRLSVSLCSALLSPAPAFHDLSKRHPLWSSGFRSGSQRTGRHFRPTAESQSVSYHSACIGFQLDGFRILFRQECGWLVEWQPAEFCRFCDFRILTCIVRVRRI